MKAKKTYIGGQALIEGVMMRGKTAMASAVRDGEGNIQIEAKRLPARKRSFFDLPFVRGVKNLLVSTIDGTKCLMRSAEVYADEEEEPSKTEKFFAEKLHIDIMDAVATVSLLLGVLLALGLFFFLPQFLTGLIFDVSGLPKESAWYYVVVGAIKLVIFILYLLCMLLIKDMRRTFTFLFLVVAVNILLFALVGYFLRLGAIENGALRLLARLGTEIVLLPVVAGISYELLKALAKTDSKLVLPLKAPGLLLQRITTQEPTDDMIEVAIAAFTRVRDMDGDAAIPESRFVLSEKLSVLLERTKKQFSEADIDESDAEWIYAMGLGIHRSELAAERMVAPSAQREIQKTVEERLTGKPLWYITGDTDFCGVTIKTDARALIPRPETEELAAAAIREVKRGRRTVLDVCTGSGCIAIAIAKETGAEVTASDLSAEALSLAKENAEANGVGVTFVESDLLEKVEGKFDLIVCNPPYVPTGFIAKMQREVREFEPHMALDGGEDGMDFYRRMAEEAPAHLKEGGAILFECGEEQAHSICSFFEGRKTEIIKDLEGVERIVKIC